jgi:Glycosyltransferases, probably involved in cell wall biogenesis
VVPAYNEERVIKKSLRNLLSLDYGALEVVFVDDASVDDTLETAKKFEDDRMTVLSLSENGGKAAAVNEALEEVDTQYFAVQDADSVATGDALRMSVDRLESEPQLAAVIASIRPLDTDSLITKIQSVEYVVTNYVRSLTSKIDTLECTPGAFSMYRTAEVRSAGGFDEGNPTEDLEMAWNLRKNGNSIAMVYSAVSRTELPEDMGALFNQRVRWARGWIHNMLKHRDMLFDSSYGWFGRLQLPLQLCMPVVALIGFFMVVVGWGQSLYDFAITVPVTGLKPPSVPDRSSLLGLPWKVYGPLGVNMLMSAVLISRAYRTSDRSVRHIPGLLIFFFGFFVLKGIFWVTAILKHAAGVDTSWT